MTRRPARLGLFCPGNGTGGPWRYVHSLLAGLDPAEFAVTVFGELPDRTGQTIVSTERTASACRGNAGDGANGDSTSILGGSLGRLTPPARVGLPPAVALWLGFARETRRLAKLIRPHRLNLFHTQNTGCEESPVAARLAGVPNILGTFHVDSTYDLHHERDGLHYRLLERLSNRCLHRAIAVSESTGRNWQRRTFLPSARVSTIRNGIDPVPFLNAESQAIARQALHLPADALIVGGLGRLEEAKGFTDLIAAVTQLRAEFPNLIFAIAGQGPLRATLEAFANPAVRFLGFQSDVARVLAACDIFALSSRCEALPYAVLEAMASGLPVVGTRVGGVPEMISHGVTGFLVPPRDPSALAGAIRTLAKSAELRVSFGAAGRERVTREFHERDMVRRTLQMYRNLLTGRR